MSTDPARSNNPTDQETRVALVTGSSKGIGRAAARRLARDGFVVAVNYRSDEPAAQDVVREIESEGGSAAAFQADVGVDEDATRLVRATIDHFGRVDVLVNNAAIFPWEEWSGISTESWDRVFAVNVRGAYVASREAFADMKQRRWGRLIFMASRTFFTGSPSLIHYASSKGAIVGMVRSMALAVGDYGITANAVATGRTMTEGLEGLIEQGATTYQESNDRTGQAIKRLAEPEDIVGTISFLASADASYMTGQVLNVDGGRTMY